MLTKILFLSALYSITLAENSEPLFAFEDCGGTHLKFNNISIKPLPIKLSKTDKIYLTANVDVMKDLPLDAISDLQLTKLVDVGNDTMPIDIPCLNDMGSCKLPVCDLFAKWYNSVICPFFTRAHVPCECPVRKTHFEGQDIQVEVPFDKIKGMIAYLASGQYKVEYRITDGLKKVNYSCLHIRAYVDVEKQ
ncbi:ganglioside GM2 activator-like [Oppia nitens]|uniref:ganglioside GM2 activator-like n=1 Tax=Oppia nitens TaxID=1686743 RepID=UPI0023DAA559|nr:ganglioside GM2 activator-like [Oppia nitens]